MIIFFAGADSNPFGKILKEAKVKGVLLSQFYSHDKPLSFFEEYIKGGSKVFMDSGGFTARIKGVPLKVEDYVKFLIKNKTGWTWCANLDVMDPEETLGNQKYIEAAGIKPVPVFHYSEIKLGRKELLEYYCKNYPYVALGGVAATVRNPIIKKKYFGYCFSIGMKYKTKFHGFGVTDEESLMTYPWFSVDSTSWLGGAKFARVYKFVNGRLDAFELKLSKGVEKHINSWFRLSNPLQYVDLEKTEYVARCRQNIKAFSQWEDYLTKLWEKRGIKWNN